MTSYRETRPATTNSSDDSSSNSESDDEDQPWKRRKTSSHLQGIPRKANSLGWNRAQTNERSSNASDGAAKQPKRNNVWSQVVQEQNEDLVAREMDAFDMESLHGRDVESYNYRLAKEKNLQARLGAPSVSTDVLQKRSLKRGFGETEDDGWLVNRPGSNPHHGSDGAAADDTRKPVHERLGTRDTTNRKTVKARRSSHSGVSDKSSMKFIRVDPSLDKVEFTKKLAFSLQEAKKDLIGRVVEKVGVDKSHKLWMMTANIERDGGIMVLNGSRRRSPGGVFLHLMRTDPHITKQQINEIFAEERKKGNEQKHKRDRSRRRKKAHPKHGEGDAGAAKECKETEMASEEGEGANTVVKRENSANLGKEAASTQGMEIPCVKKEPIISGVSEEGEPISAEEIEGNGSLVAVKVEKKQGGNVSSMEEGEIEDVGEDDKIWLRQQKNSDMEEGEIEDDD